MNAIEFKVVAMRECPIPDAEADGRNPENCVKYWKAHIATEPHYDPERECLVVLLLDGRRWIKGHSFISHGTADTVVGQPKDIMRVNGRKVTAHETEAAATRWLAGRKATH